jgi:hypothetical protein
MASRQRKKQRAETVAAAESLDRLYELVKGELVPPPPAGFHTVSELAERAGKSEPCMRYTIQCMFRAGKLTRVKGKPPGARQASWYYGEATKS